MSDLVRTLPRGACAALLAMAALFPGGRPAAGQAPVERIVQQDPALDNLVTPPGYATTALGSLGGVLRLGHGPRHMILIPGLGFGGEVFRPLMEALADEYTMWAVTLPGFGGTAAPGHPPAGTSFGEQTWTEGALEGIERLVAADGIRDAVVVGHWLGGTQLAIRLARRHPDVVRRVVLLAASARFAMPGRAPIPLDEQIALVDQGLAPRWFKTVTRETWDDNNFLPQDYASHPVLGLRLWREAARPPLHVWVRYLCEYHAQDAAVELERLSMPTLLLLPGLEGLWLDPANDYMRAFTAEGWTGARRPGVEVRTVPGTRAVMWADEPGRVIDEMRRFLAPLASP